MNGFQQALQSAKNLFGIGQQNPQASAPPPMSPPVGQGYGQILNNFATGVQQKFGSFMQSAGNGYMNLAQNAAKNFNQPIANTVNGIAGNIGQMVQPIANTLNQGVQSGGRLAAYINPSIQAFGSPQVKQAAGIGQGYNPGSDVLPFLRAGLTAGGLVMNPMSAPEAGLVMGGLKAGQNLIQKQPIGNNLNQSIGEGAQFGAMVGPIGKLAGLAPTTSAGSNLLSKLAPGESPAAKVLGSIGGGVAKEALTGAGYGAVTGQNPVTSALQFAPYGLMGMGGEANKLSLDKGAVLDNSTAKEAVNIIKEYDQTKGNPSMDAISSLRDIYIDKLGVKPKDFSKIPTDQAFENLRSYVTRNQNYVFNQLGMPLAGNSPEVKPVEPIVKPTASDFEAEMNAQIGKIAPEDINKMVTEHGKVKEYYRASMPTLDSTKNEMAAGTINSAFDQGPMKKYFADWVNARKSSPVEGMIKGNEFSDLDSQGMKGILDFQAGDKTGRFADLKRYFDQRYKEAKSSGLDFNYKQDYLPQLWANSPEEVRAVFERNLGKKPSFTMDSVFKSYKEGIDAGLTPRFTQVSDLVKWYESTYTKNLADRNFFQQLIKDGQIASPSKSPPGWTTLDPDRFPMFKVNVPEGTYQGAYKAPPELADMINNYLKAPQFKFLNDIANFTSTAKNRALSFGVPTTAINMHGVNIMARDVLFGSSGNPITRFLTDAKYMLNPNSAGEMVKENLTKAPFAIKSGLTLGVEDHSSLGEAPSVLSKFGNTWNNLFEKPLFGKMIPALKLQNFYSVFEDYKKSMPEEQAAKEAARITNNVYGGFNWEELGKSRDMQNLKRATILAPDWLESNLRLGGNVVKALATPTNPAGKAYRAAATNLIGAYVLANAANKISSGHYMFQNDPGHTFEVQTGFTADGQKRYFRPFGTAVDFVRIPYDIALGLAKGDPTTAFRAIANRLSIPLGASLGLLTNTDYLGNPIYGSTMTPKQSIMGTVGQLAGAAGIPSFAKNALDVASGKTGIEQGITQGAELPFRYSGGAATKKIVTQMKGQGATDSAVNDKLNQMSNSAQAKQKILTGIDPKIQNALTVADSLSTPSGDVGQDLSNKYARANLYLGNPSLLAAKSAIAQAQAQANGTDLNPLYALTPDQQKIVLRYESLQPGTDKSAYYKNNIQFLQPYYNAENQYYAKNPIQNPNTTSPKAPVASARAQALMNAGNFRDPEVQAYLQQNTAYKNYQREALGLGPLASSSGGSSGGRGMGGLTSFQRSSIKQKLAPKKVKIGIKKVTLAKGIPPLQAKKANPLGKANKISYKVAKAKLSPIAKSKPKFKLAKAKSKKMSVSAFT